MDTFWDIIKQPFVWGLAIGLVLTFFTWKSSMGAKRQLKKDHKRVSEEMRTLENHLNTQLKINASGNSALQEQLDTLKEQNEVLRVNLAALQTKPGRSELRHLNTMENAIRVMREQAPGFASAWEVALRQAETEYDESLGGFRRLMRKVVSLPGPAETSDKSQNKDPE